MAETQELPPPPPGAVPVSTGPLEAVWPHLEKQESGGKQKAVSPVGAIGVAQIMPETAPLAAKMAGLPWDAKKYKEDADYNRKLGQAYLDHQLETFKGDVPKALAAYNAGPGKVARAVQKYGDKWLEKMPEETRNYVSTITANAAASIAPPPGATPAMPAPPPGAMPVAASDSQPPLPPPPPGAVPVDAQLPPPPPGAVPVDQRSSLQKAAQVAMLPIRAGRAVGVGLERVAANAKHLVMGEPMQSEGQIEDRIAAAFQPDYVPQQGEKLGAYGGDAVGSIPLAAVMAVPAAAVASTLGLGVVGAAALEGGLTGLGFSAISQKAAKDKVDAFELAMSGALGTFLGGATGAAGSWLGARRAVGAAAGDVAAPLAEANQAVEAASAALEKDPLAKAQVLQNEARMAAAQQELVHLESVKPQVEADLANRTAAAGGVKDANGTQVGEVLRNVNERISTLRKWIAEMDTFSKAKAGVAGVAGKDAAELAAPRIAAMSPAERLRNATELEAAAKQGLVKNIGSLPEEEQLPALLGRKARGPIESEKALLGLQTSTRAERLVAEDAITAAAAGRPLRRTEFQPVNQAVAEAIANGEITPDQAFKLMGIPNLDTTANRVKAAQTYMEMASQYGKGLAQLSRIGQNMEVMLGKDPAVKALFDAKRAAGKVGWEYRPWTPWTAVGDAYRSADNFRRAAMTSGIGTTVRNILSQGERSLSAAFEHALSGAQGAITGKISPLNAFDDVAADFMGLARALKPSTRAEIDSMLKYTPLEYQRLLGTQYGDLAVGGKVSYVLNYGNVVQEKFFRRAAFDAWINQTLAKSGRTLSQVTEKDIQAAAQYALEMTYAATPKQGTLGNAVLELYKRAPILTAVGNPFPRFWLNAMSRLYDLSPLPLFSSATYRAMSHPDPKIAFQAINRSVYGTGLMAAGYALAQSGHTGEKWYEFKIGNKVYDMRPYSPVSAVMAVGKIISDAEVEGKWALMRLTPEDWSQIAFSMKRTDATGIPLFDMAFARSGNELKSDLVATISSYVGSFVPRVVASARDARGVVSSDARTPRNLSVPPWGMSTDPTQRTGTVKTFITDAANSSMAAVFSQIPFLSDTLYRRASPMRPGAEERVDPMARVAGLGARIKTPVEAEADRLGLRPRDIYPHTGNPEYDRLIVENMGPQLAMNLENLRTSPLYMKSSNEDKKALFKRELAIFRQVSMYIVAKDRPKGRNLLLEYLGKGVSAQLKGEEIEQSYRSKMGEP